jgi:ATP-dependent Clp protease ATP-binding subunit ClpA
MFERFAEPARRTVARAQDEAAALHHGYIGTEHLLLALAAEPEGTARTALRALGVEHAAVLAAVEEIIGRGSPGIDPDALALIGIDLDEVRRRVEEAFGPGALDRRPGCRRGRTAGHIPFTPRSKKVLELALREAVALGHDRIGNEHLLLALIRERDGIACRILTAGGRSPDELRDVVLGSFSPPARAAPPSRRSAQQRRRGR